MNFDEKAHLYENISTSQKQAAEYLNSLLEFVQDGNSILDVGCGTGYFTNLLFNRSCNTIGIDISPEMISNATRIRPYIKFDVADGETFFSDTSFDLITTNAVTYYFKNLHDAFTNFYRLLRQGGTYAMQAQTVVTPEFSNAIEMLKEDKETREIFSTFKMPTHQIEKEEYENILSDSQFDITYSEKIIYETNCDLSRAIDIFKSGTATPLLNEAAYNMKLTPNYKDAFWRIIENGLKRQLINEKITLHIPRVYILSVKR